MGTALVNMYVLCVYTDVSVLIFCDWCKKCWCVCVCLWASPWVCNSEFVFMYMHVFVLFCACLSGSLGFCVCVYPWEAS